MTTSVVSIVNRALALLEAAPISALTDPSREARQMNLIYEATRDELLAMHPWKFATARATLAESGDTPPFQYEKKYALPADYLRFQHTNVGDHQIEGKFLLTNFGPAKLIYTRKVEDPNEFATWFVTALYHALARDACLPITKDLQRYRILVERAADALAQARFDDGAENPPETFVAEDFNTARFTGTGFFDPATQLPIKVIS